MINKDPVQSSTRTLIAIHTRDILKDNSIYDPIAKLDNKSLKLLIIITNFKYIIQNKYVLYSVVLWTDPRKDLNIIPNDVEDGTGSSKPYY